MDQFCEGASLSIGELADDQLKPTGRILLTLTIFIDEVSQFHYLRKSSRWKSKKNQPPEVLILWVFIQKMFDNVSLCHSPELV